MSTRHREEALRAGGSCLTSTRWLDGSARVRLKEAHVVVAYLAGKTGDPKKL